MSGLHDSLPELLAYRSARYVALCEAAKCSPDSVLTDAELSARLAQMAGQSRSPECVAVLRLAWRVHLAGLI